MLLDITRSSRLCYRNWTARSRRGFWSRDLNPLSLLALHHLKVHTLQSALTQQKVHPSTCKTTALARSRQSYTDVGQTQQATEDALAERQFPRTSLISSLCKVSLCQIPFSDLCDAWNERCVARLTPKFHPFHKSFAVWAAENIRDRNGSTGTHSPTIDTLRQATRCLDGDVVECIIPGRPRMWEEATGTRVLQADTAARSPRQHGRQGHQEWRQWPKPCPTQSTPASFQMRNVLWGTFKIQLGVSVPLLNA